MTESVEFPLRSQQFLSTLEEDGRFRISLESFNIAAPTADEVVLRVEAAPVNPSDLGLMLAGIPADTFAPCGNDGTPALCAPASAETMARLENRIGQSLPVGLEGLATVIATGTDAASLLGKKVSIFGSGTYSQNCKLKAENCLVLPDDVAPDQGAAAFVNPVTALAIVETMRRDGHKAIVHTAAASNLGQMLVRICEVDGIGLVNVVRSQEQVDLLKRLGARYVCNSSAQGFNEELIAAIRETGATVAFDAVGGGDLASRILAAMEKASIGDEAYSRYGSDTYKHVYVYGGFDPSPIVLRKDYGLAWGLSGWLLKPMLAKLGPEKTAEIKARVVRELDTTFKSNFGQSIPLAELFDPDKLVAAAVRSTGGKFLLKPNG